MAEEPTLAVDSSAEPLRARLQSFEIRNFRVIKQERLAVHPRVTAIVGRNDVGKSTLLKAIELYGWARQGAFSGLLTRDDINSTRGRSTQLIAEWEVSGGVWRHSLDCDLNAPEERLEHEGLVWKWRPLQMQLEAPQGTFTLSHGDLGMSLAEIEPKRWRIDAGAPRDACEPLAVTRAFRTPRAYLFEPSALMKSAPISLTDATRNGVGWSFWLQEVITRRDNDITRLEEEVKKLFPFFRSVEIKKTFSTSRNRVGRQAFLDVVVSLASSEGFGGRGEPVRAGWVSSGLLLALAHFALIFAPDKGSLILLEEPENGMNARITFDMMKSFLAVIREREHQLIFTTHNEWWLDLVEPESIRVLTRDSDGAHIHDPAKEQMKKLLKDSDVYPSEIMSTLGPEGLLGVQAPQR
jgi:energy-coupling factor transporter ATP-binding protein EcfA2